MVIVKQEHSTMKKIGFVLAAALGLTGCNQSPKVQTFTPRQPFPSLNTMDKPFRLQMVQR